MSDSLFSYGSICFTSRRDGLISSSLFFFFLSRQGWRVSCLFDYYSPVLVIPVFDDLFCFHPIVWIGSRLSFLILWSRIRRSWNRHGCIRVLGFRRSVFSVFVLDPGSLFYLRVLHLSRWLVLSFGMYIGMRIMPDSSPILGIYIYYLCILQDNPKRIRSSSLLIDLFCPHGRTECLNWKLDMTAGNVIGLSPNP